MVVTRVSQCRENPHPCRQFYHFHIDADPLHCDDQVVPRVSHSMMPRVLLSSNDATCQLSHHATCPCRCWSSNLSAADHNCEAQVMPRFNRYATCHIMIGAGAATSLLLITTQLIGVDAAPATKTLLQNWPALSDVIFAQARSPQPVAGTAAYSTDVSVITRRIVLKLLQLQ